MVWLCFFAMGFVFADVLVEFGKFKAGVAIYAFCDVEYKLFLFIKIVAEDDDAKIKHSNYVKSKFEKFMS